MRLMTPTAEFSDEIRSYREEFMQTGDSMDGTGALFCLETPEVWLDHTVMCSKRESVPENWVVATQFICVREEDQRIVGMIQVRHYFNEFLEKFGGNIGYGVRPSERGKGYAGDMLAQVLPYCREIGLERVLVTCKKENEASRRTILKNGGKYESTADAGEGTILERYWIGTGD